MCGLNSVNKNGYSRNYILPHGIISVLYSNLGLRNLYAWHHGDKQFAIMYTIRGAIADYM